MNYITTIITALIFLYFYNTYAKDSIILAVSANAQYVIDEIIKAYKQKHTDVSIKKIVSSSGKLTNQITKGAPFDIFLSADMNYPIFLYKKGLTITKPKTYAYGLIVLWTTKNFSKKDLNINIIYKVNKIAIPNPKTAPYGRESIKILKNLKVFKKIKNRIIYGESVSQVNYYILKGFVDIGFTSKSSVLAPVVKSKGIWVEVDKNLYNPIKQGAVLLKNAKNKKQAYEFFRFLFSKKAKEIFKKYGYLVKDE